MIKAHSTYMMPTDRELSKAINYVGYGYYIPPKLFADLVSLYSHHMITGNTGNHFTVVDNPTTYIEKKNALYNMLDYDYYKGESPLHKALYTLKDLSQIINMRSFENEEDNFEQGFDNYVESPDDTDELILTTGEEGIDPDNIAYIMRLVGPLRKNLRLGRPSEETETTRGRMKTFKDVFSARKSDLVKPDFKHKLINKKLIVGSDAVTGNEEPVIIYLEDASHSMQEDNGLIISKAVQILITKDSRPVHYYRYVDTMIEFFSAETVEEKIDIFSASKKYLKGGCDYDTLFKMINEKYKSGDVIISTDGKDHVPRYKHSNLTFNCVGVKSDSMAQYVKASGGIYLTI